MKKLISLILTLCILCGMCAVSATALDSTSKIILPFDYDGNGKIDLEDARIVLAVSAGTQLPQEVKTYDADGDGAVTYADVLMLMEVATGIYTPSAEKQAEDIVLFKNELNEVKDKMPGFKKTVTNHVTSSRVTSSGNPSQTAELNVTNMEFSAYVDLVEETTEGLLNGVYGWLLDDAEKAEIRQGLKEMQAAADELYKPQTNEEEVAASSYTHFTKFPVNKLGYSCYVTIDDIESITTYEDSEYIYRIVTMPTETFVGDEYPTGSGNFEQRWKNTKYGHLFNIPDVDETDGSVLTSLTFKNGRVISKIDKATGVPVSVEYFYTYISDIQQPVEKNSDGSDGVKMSTKTTMDVYEYYELNKMEPIEETSYTVGLVSDVHIDSTDSSSQAQSDFARALKFY